MEDIQQFGAKPQEKYRERPSAYVLVFNDQGRILTVKVNETYHLVGGGIDAHEKPEEAVIRETQEETGYDITDLQFIGRANQFFLRTEGGPLNKIAVFYKGQIKGRSLSVAIETDHKVCWLSPEEFMDSSAGEFQKWAVQSACGGIETRLVR